MTGGIDPAGRRRHCRRGHGRADRTVPRRYRDHRHLGDRCRRHAARFRHSRGRNLARHHRACAQDRAGRRQQQILALRADAYRHLLEIDVFVTDRLPSEDDRRDVPAMRRRGDRNRRTAASRRTATDARRRHSEHLNVRFFRLRAKMFVIVPCCESEAFDKPRRNRGERFARHRDSQCSHPRATSPSSAAASMAAASRATPSGAAGRCFSARRAISPAATSSASSKLIHGGLRYLEYYEFRLVREALHRARGALADRAAYHLAAALRPAAPRGPAAGLVAAARPVSLRSSRRRASCCRRRERCDLRDDPAGAPLKPRIHARASNIPIAGSRIRGWSCSTRATPPTGARRSRRARAASRRAREDGPVAPDDARRDDAARLTRSPRARWSMRPGPGSATCCRRRLAPTPAPRCGWSRAATSSSRGCSTTTAATSSRTPTAASSSPSPTSATSR